VLEELGRRADRHARGAVEVGQAAARSSISRVGPPPPSPWPNGISDQSLHPCRGSRRRVRQLGGRDLGVVGVDRREVGEHPGAVDALPPERVVREPVVLFHDSFWVTKLACRRRRRAGAGRRVAEHVGDPHLGAAHAVAEPVLEPALPEHDLADEALARRQVHVGLDPHAADRDPAPAATLLADAFEQVGVALLDPGVLLGLRAGEPVLGVLVHQPHRRRERAGALADRLADRPQPRRVDVGVPVATTRWALAARRLASSGRARGGRRSTSGTRRGHVRGCAAAGPAVGRRGERAHQPVEHVEVVHQRLGLVVDQHELGARNR
jgi:hypothetical protein